MAIAEQVQLSFRETARQRASELDQFYLSRFVPDSVEEDSQSKYTANIVLGRMKDEEDTVQWVYDKLHNVAPYIYVVDDNTTAGPHLEMNHGREAAVYMKYIVENYDSLPDITFFWHGQEVTWHNNLLLGSNSVTQLNRMDRDNIMRQGYVPSRCDLWPGCPTWVHFNPSKAEHRLDPHRLEQLFNIEIFSELFPDVENFPPYFAGTCCSQFAVSRDQIHSRPKEQYERLYKWATEFPDDAESGRVFEFTWPYIFLGRGTYCPSMQECYCKTYNLCIEDTKDLADLDRWNALRTRREELQWQLTFIREALKTEQEEHRGLGASEEQMRKINATFEPEIDRLKDALEHMAMITWEQREEIIQHWNIAPPPEGW